MKRPNLVIIMADQLRYDAMGAHGNPDIITPMQGIKLELKVLLLEWNARTENPLDPALVWQLGQKYDKWQGATGGNEARHLPYWTDEKYLDWVYTQ